MVVLAASIITKTGKALVSRQYMEMSRVRIEGLLAAFPKLVGSGKQHTYVETENVRYVYQPMEGLYLLLITNKQSNIMEDLDTLRTVSKLIPEFSSALDEETISKAAFDLIFAFDEVISLGHKDSITIQQIKQNCGMESHEEKLHKMIIQSKINDTKDIMKKKAMEIDKGKIDQKKMADKFSSFGAPALGSFMSTSSSGGAMDDPVPSFGRIDPAPAATGLKMSSKNTSSKGMQLGKAKKGNDLLQNLVKEGEMVELEKPTKSAGISTAAVSVSSDPVFLSVEEKLSVSLNKEGGVENIEIQGTMSLLVSSDEDALCKVLIETGPNKNFQFKTHPNIDKGLYSSSNVLGLKDPSRPFPTGNELGILKWRLQSKDDKYVPLSINCWPSVSGSDSYVNIEYESSGGLDLQNVQVIIPLPHVSHAPTINQIDGEWRFDARRSALIWQIDLIDDTNRSGSLEFVVPAADPETFYPVEVSFACSKIFCDVTVDSVVHAQKETPIKYGIKKSLQTAGYQVA